MRMTESVWCPHCGVENVERWIRHKDIEGNFTKLEYDPMTHCEECYKPLGEEADKLNKLFIQRNEDIKKTKE